MVIFYLKHCLCVKYRCSDVHNTYVGTIYNGLTHNIDNYLLGDYLS